MSGELKAEQRGLGLGELCSKTLLLCYAPMLSNALIMLLRIVIMLTLCSLIILFMSTWSRGGELRRVAKSTCKCPMEDCSAVHSTVELVKSELAHVISPIPVEESQSSACFVLDS